MSNIKISNLSFKYSDSIENIFNNLNLDLDSSWKLGLVGRNGRGKTICYKENCKEQEQFNLNLNLITFLLM